MGGVGGDGGELRVLRRQRRRRTNGDLAADIAVNIFAADDFLTAELRLYALIGRLEPRQILKFIAMIQGYYTYASLTIITEYILFKGNQTDLGRFALEAEFDILQEFRLNLFEGINTERRFSRRSAFLGTAGAADEGRINNVIFGADAETFGEIVARLAYVHVGHQVVRLAVLVVAFQRYLNEEA